MTKKFIAVVLAMIMTGCATVRRHPVVFVVAGSVVVGVAIALVQRKGHCPGEYVSGDPPCPPPEVDYRKGK